MKLLEWKDQLSHLVGTKWIAYSGFLFHYYSDP